MELQYPKKLYHNKEINLIKMEEENSNELISPIYKDGLHKMFTTSIAYHLYDIKCFPLKKYKIEVLDYIFDEFQLKSFFSENCYSCSVILKINISDLKNKTDEIKYIKFANYNFYNKCIDDDRSYSLSVDYIYVQGNDIMNDLIECGKRKIPEIVKELNIDFYNRNKKFLRWK